ncbi:MAG: acetyl-CoA carboxylase, carboxyltransferase subunit beta [Thermoanaerobaculia bacterium]|nr:acetyl-CoA carboxylase, carboxyltransferase subunit beta [Thermoanaerobaculia bacterium]
MPWFRKDKQPKAIRKERLRSPVPEGLWAKCEGCKEAIYARELERNLHVCPKCGFHSRLDAWQRIGLLLDDAEPRELFSGLRSADPLHFKDTKKYRDRLKTYQASAGGRDAVVVVEGSLEGVPIVLAVMQYPFMGGSMGSVVGEKITRAAETALASRRPLIVVSASGGARMQEGVLSLMQMAKISAALARLSAARIPYLSILTDPTTGGVTASFAMLGDINLAEPGALIGFAGPRVIQQTIRQDLPEGFQRSEFLLRHGFLDFVVSREEMKSTVARCLRHLVA